MNIAGIVKTSTIDYLGKIASVVFVAGCNYDCWFCHNRALLSNPPLLDEGEFFSFLRKRANVLEGVVISGGEPTQQKDLFSFAAKIKDIGYSVKLDTNGSNPKILSSLLQNSIIDYVAVDYKAPFEKYFDICKHDASGVEECIEILRQSTISWEMRTTLIPQLSTDDLVAMAERAPQLPLYALQKYRNIGYDERDETCNTCQIEELIDIVKRYQPNVVARGF